MLVGVLSSMMVEMLVSFLGKIRTEEADVEGTAAKPPKPSPCAIEPNPFNAQKVPPPTPPTGATPKLAALLNLIRA